MTRIPKSDYARRRKALMAQMEPNSIAILPALPPGLNRARMLAALESRIEAETDRLMAEPQHGTVDKSVD
ncbi:MAG: hypothetical protein B7Z23_03485 [Pseudomonadales bacterium 32-61-5]|nr:MAG: hypothetical protein B7Z23_03485 [Pseudomonadales bacterium 32-61-5]